MFAWLSDDNATGVETGALFGRADEPDDVRKDEDKGAKTMMSVYICDGHLCQPMNVTKHLDGHST